MKRLIYLLAFCPFFLNCKSDVEAKEEKKEVIAEAAPELSSSCIEYLLKEKMNNLNISILLDLSDRIDRSQQVEKDAAYIASIAQLFNEHIKGKKLGLLNDKIGVYFEPAPTNPEINSLAEELKVSYVKGVSKNEWMPKTEKLYGQIPSEIYTLAKKDAGSNGGYPGSDIWRFFKDKVEDYSINDCTRNILVVLTDGYMFHENTKMNNGNRTSYLTPRSLADLGLNTPDWKKVMEEKDLGFISANKDLGDLEVLVLGIESLNETNPYARDVITTYWSNWFESMGVKRYKIKESDIPSNIHSVISEFIIQGS